MDPRCRALTRFRSCKGVKHNNSRLFGVSRHRFLSSLCSTTLRIFWLAFNTCVIPSLFRCLYFCSETLGVGKPKVEGEQGGSLCFARTQQPGLITSVISSCITVQSYERTREIFLLVENSSELTQKKKFVRRSSKRAPNITAATTKKPK